MMITQNDMDNMVDAEVMTLSNGVLTKLSSGCFSYTDDNGYSYTGSTGSVWNNINQSMTATPPLNMSIASTFGGLTSAMGVAYPQSRPSLTADERKRLTELESQVKAHAKFEQLKKFKAMPRHIRQAIVDDCYVRDLTSDLNQNHEASFQFSQELKDLRDKNNGYMGSYHINSTNLSGIFTHQEYGNGGGGKFSSIISKFSTEELARAHSEMCLEEDLNED
jgi:hypothetical protein